MKLEKLNQDTLFNPDNVISDPEIFTRKAKIIEGSGEILETKEFNDNSLFSPRIFGDMDSEEDYSCQCGKTTGKFYEGKVCQKCGTEVKFVALTVNKTGWIDLSFSKYEEGVCVEKGNGIHLIEYIAYSQLEKIIGKDNLRNILHVRNTLSLTGEINEEEIEEIRNQKPEFKYYHYGIEKFYENYNEILEYYFNLKKEKGRDLYNFLKNKDEVFTDKIPVISIILRPAMRTADGLKLDQINIRYQNILKNLQMIQDVNTISLIRDSIVEIVQAEYMLLSEDIMDAIKSKAGIIRNQICGTRINFSARNIISPAKKGYKLDEIVVPYLTFLELYKFEIISILRKTENISFKEAQDEWFRATLQLNKKVYKIMKKIVKENEVGVLLNRNPTIAYGSILYLKIVDIKEDYSDATMSISNTILTPLAGDYDGDVLNLISIKDSYTRDVFKKIFSPVHLIIDPNSGKFNNALNLERDQILGFSRLLDK